MNRVTWAKNLLPPIILSGCAAVLAVWMKLPWPAVAALGILSVIIASVSNEPKALLRNRFFAAVGCTLVAAAGMWFARSETRPLDLNHAVLGTLNAAAILIASRGITDARTKKRWRMLGLGFGFFAGIVCVGVSYSRNLSAPFHLGLLMNAVLLILSKSFFRMPGFLVQLANTLLLLLIGLPAVDWVVRPRYRLETDPDPHAQYYLYRVAKKNPGGFAAWQAAYEKQSHLFWRHIYSWRPFGADPGWTLKTNITGSLFQSRISINSQGFRGREIPADKGVAYRIVVLGESTTFDLTLTAEDKPWTELLEQMIRDQLKPDRPVEVINAGVPGYHLKHNLDRLPGEILPLKPDLIISYHGYNGFHFINPALPMAFVKDPPAYEPRPLKLAADVEYRLKVAAFRRATVAKVAGAAPSVAEPKDTEYAALYRQLIQIARTNHIRVALASYSMAVNQKSEPEIIEFYRPTFPLIYWQIKANEIHATILKQLAMENPDVCFIDTRPQLDGREENFIDLIHFSPEGRQRLAEIMFEGIKPVLQPELQREGFHRGNAE